MKCDVWVVVPGIQKSRIFLNVLGECAVYYEKAMRSSGDPDEAGRALESWSGGVRESSATFGDCQVCTLNARNAALLDLLASAR